MFAEGRLHGRTLDKDSLKSGMLALRIVLRRLLNSEQVSGSSAAEPYHRVQVDGLETPVICLPRRVCKVFRAPSEMAQYHPILFAVPSGVKIPGSGSHISLVVASVVTFNMMAENTNGQPSK